MGKESITLSMELEVTSSNVDVLRIIVHQAVCALRSLSIMGGIQNLIICVKMTLSEHLDCGVNIR